MKTIVIFVVLALSAAFSNAQEVIELKEAKVEFNPVSQTITNRGNSFSVNIRESYRGEFEKAPLAFAENHFDIEEVIAAAGVNDYHIYRVSFLSRKGELIVNFDRNGKKIGSSMRFENIVVPSQLQHQLYRDYKGWAMVKTLHIAKESNGNSLKDFYKVTMKMGNQKKKLKINTSEIGSSTLVAVK